MQFLSKTYNIGQNEVLFAVATKTANYTLTTEDDIIKADATSGAITMTLPTAVGAKKMYCVKKIDSTSNAVNVATTSAQTIDGSSSIAITVQNTALTFVSDGANWIII